MTVIDTTPLVALCDHRDGLHDVAWEDLATLGGGPFGIIEPVLAEALFLLRPTHLRLRLRRLLLEELNVTLLSLPHERAPLESLFEWLSRYAEHTPGWADAGIAVLCGLEKGLKVWTYDREFTTIWRKPDGSVIPMAVKM
jgi:predicted nucleic acid-binding protein